MTANGAKCFARNCFHMGSSEYAPLARNPEVGPKRRSSKLPGGGFTDLTSTNETSDSLDRTSIVRAFFNQLRSVSRTAWALEP